MAYVNEAQAEPFRHLSQRGDLLPHRAFEGCGRHGRFQPSEILAIGIAGVRADGDIQFLRRLNCLPHRALVAGVAAAGNIRGCDVAHQFEVGAAGQRFGRFAEVGIDIDENVSHSLIVSPPKAVP